MRRCADAGPKRSTVLARLPTSSKSSTDEMVLHERRRHRAAGNPTRPVLPKRDLNYIRPANGRTAENNGDGASAPQGQRCRLLCGTPAKKEKLKTPRKMNPKRKGCTLRVFSFSFSDFSVTAMRTARCGRLGVAFRHDRYARGHGP